MGAKLTSSLFCSLQMLTNVQAREQTIATRTPSALILKAPMLAAVWKGTVGMDETVQVKLWFKSLNYQVFKVN